MYHSIGIEIFTFFFFKKEFFFVVHLFCLKNVLATKMTAGPFEILLLVDTVDLRYWLFCIGEGPIIKYMNTTVYTHTDALNTTRWLPSTSAADQCKLAKMPGFIQNSRYGYRKRGTAMSSLEAG